MFHSRMPKHRRRPHLSFRPECEILSQKVLLSITPVDTSFYEDSTAEANSGTDYRFDFPFNEDVGPGVPATYSYYSYAYATSILGTNYSHAYATTTVNAASNAPSDGSENGTVTINSSSENDNQNESYTYTFAQSSWSYAFTSSTEFLLNITQSSLWTWIAPTEAGTRDIGSFDVMNLSTNTSVAHYELDVNSGQILSNAVQQNLPADQYSIKIIAATGATVAGSENTATSAQTSEQSVLDWQILPETLTITSLNWRNANDGGVDVAYAVGPADLPSGSTIDFYWATAPSVSDEIEGSPIYSAQVNTAAGTADTITVPASTLGPAPNGDPAEVPAYLLAVDDVPQSNDTNPSFQSVPFDPITTDELTSPDSQEVTFTYEITEDGLEQPFEAAIYRSNVAPSLVDGSLALGSAVPVDDTTIPGQDIDSTSSTALGEHTVLISDSQIAAGLHPDPTHEYVTLVADPNNYVGIPDDPNHVTYFRKFVLGVVVHGFQLQGGLTGVPAWENQAAALLTTIGYNAVIPFNWTSNSNFKAPGVTEYEGTVLAQDIVMAADSLVQTQGSPNDVVDLHLIGHSRGSVVISQALIGLSSSSDSAIIGGYKIMTMLDPHPANNSYANPDFSAANNFLGKFAASVYKSFQAVAEDPQVVIPPNVDEADLYYQNTPASAFSPLKNPAESVINLWGEGPSFITNESSAVVQVHNLTGVVDPTLGPIGHGEVPEWYLEYILPIEALQGYGTVLGPMAVVAGHGPGQIAQEPPGSSSVSNLSGKVATSSSSASRPVSQRTQAAVPSKAEVAGLYYKQPASSGVSPVVGFVGVASDLWGGGGGLIVNQPPAAVQNESFTDLVDPALVSIALDDVTSGDELYVRPIKDRVADRKLG